MPILSKISDILTKSKDFYLATFEQGLSSGANFITTFIVMIQLSAKEFGYFSYLLGLLYMIISLQEACLSTPMLSILPKIKLKNRMDYRQVFLLQLFFSLLAAFILILIVLYLGSAWISIPTGLYAPFIALMAFYQIQEFIRKYLLAHTAYESLLMFSAISNIGQVVFLLLVMILKLTTVSSVIRVMAFTTLLAIAYVVFNSQLFKLRAKIEQPVNQSRIFNIGFWNMLSATVGTIISQVINTIVAAMFGMQILGVIRAISSIYNAPNLFISSARNTMVVMAAKSLQLRSEQETRKVLWGVTWRYFFLICGIQLVATVVSAFVLFKRFHSIASPTELMLAGAMFCTGTLLNVLFLPFVCMQTAMESTKKLSIITTVISLISAPVTYILLKTTGWTAIFVMGVVGAIAVRVAVGYFYRKETLSSAIPPSASPVA